MYFHILFNELSKLPYCLCRSSNYSPTNPLQYVKKYLKKYLFFYIFCTKIPGPVRQIQWRNYALRALCALALSSNYLNNVARLIKSINAQQFFFSSSNQLFQRKFSVFLNVLIWSLIVELSTTVQHFVFFCVCAYYYVFDFTIARSVCF